MPPSRQLTAIMFTDIVGYTSLMGHDDRRAFELLSKNRQIQIPIIEQFNGIFIKELGDGILACFPTASDALFAAMKIQNACSASNELSLRIGIHEGETTFENNDVFGDAVNIASRIETLGIPGSILFSKKITDEVKNKTEFQTVSLGIFEFKNVHDPVEVFALANDGFPVPKRSMMEGKLKKKNFRKRSIIAIFSILLFITAAFFIYKKIYPKIDTAGIYKSIAVLPFIDMSPQKDQEYFCDGITEELINRLSNIRELKVPARTSVFTFKGKAENIRDIGHKLNVETVLEGSIRKAGNKLRITAQLINITDGYHLWSETYDRDVKEVFAIQDEISSAIVEALKLTLTSAEKQKIAERPMDNIEAYEYYLRALPDIYRFSEDALDRALQNLLKGIEISGDNALLYSGMALVYWQYVNIGVKQDEYIMKAENYINKALQLNPHSPQAYVVLGAIEKDFHGNPQEAIRDFKKALVENPNELNALVKLAYLYILEGKPAAALPLLEKSKRIDPLNQANIYHQGIYYLYGSNYGKALELFRNLYQSEHEDISVQFWYSWTLAYNNELKTAFSIIEQSAKKSPGNVMSKFGLMLKYGLMKNKNKVLTEMTSEFQITCRRDPEWSYIVSLILSVSDIKEDALDWLDNAVNRGFFNYPLLQKDPFLDNIRHEDRFKKLMERVKIEWEKFEV